MSDFRPFPDPLDRLGGIDIHTDPGVPAGTAVLDFDAEEPRYITRIRAASIDFTLTGEQTERVRDHYRAMNDRAAELMAWWDRTAAGLALRQAAEKRQRDALAAWRAAERYAAAAIPDPPRPFHITDI